MARPKNSVKDITGKTFGQLRVKAYYGDYKWYCQCSCGKFVTVRADNLKSGNTLSCGCVHKQLHSERMTEFNYKRKGKTTEEFRKRRELHKSATDLVNIWFGKKS